VGGLIVDVGFGVRVADCNFMVGVGVLLTKRLVLVGDASWETGVLFAAIREQPLQISPMRKPTIHAHLSFFFNII